MGEGGVAAAGACGAYGDGEGFAGAGEDDELFGAGDGGVEEVALQHGRGAHGDGNDDSGVFGALRAVHGDGVGVL